jgi:hypothetical protein
MLSKPETLAMRSRRPSPRPPPAWVIISKANRIAYRHAIIHTPASFGGGTLSYVIEIEEPL